MWYTTKIKAKQPYLPLDRACCCTLGRTWYQHSPGCWSPQPPHRHQLHKHINNLVTWLLFPNTCAWGQQEWNKRNRRQEVWAWSTGSKFEIYSWADSLLHEAVDELFQMYSWADSLLHEAVDELFQMYSWADSLLHEAVDELSNKSNPTHLIHPLPLKDNFNIPYNYIIIIYNLSCECDTKLAKLQYYMCILYITTWSLKGCNNETINA